MIFLKNTHYPIPFPFYKVMWNRRYFSSVKQVEFDETIKYFIDDDQSDVNKLFGFSYGLHHYQSDRIGFRYNPSKDKVEIVLYSYVDSKRIPTIPIMDVDILTPIHIGLDVEICDDGTRQVNVYTSDGCTSLHTKIFHHVPKKLQYTLGGYFGGNRRAPHKINIKIKNVEK